MRFCEQLNEYITRLDCRGKELAEAAGMRYINGPDTVTYFGAVLFQPQQKEE